MAFIAVGTKKKHLFLFLDQPLPGAPRYTLVQSFEQKIEKLTA